MAKKKSKNSKSSSKGSTGWFNPKELVFLLIDRFPQANPKDLSANELVDMVEGLDQFDGGEAPDSDQIEELLERWYEERMEMEDELGPLRSSRPEEDLDEDDYREDRMVDEVDDEQSEVVGLDQYEDEDEEDELNPQY